MENKSPEQLSIGLPDTRKRWIVGVCVAVLLALIFVAGTLIGVYMTQKHTEQMVMVTFANAEGEKIVQTVSVNEREEVAVIYVRSDNYPGTFLFDYKKDATGNDKAAYNFQEVEEANPADVGSNVFLMCSDANIFWARNDPRGAAAQM